MAIIRVNPTRMELTRLKKRLSVARRGHKLLKDKRDELMRQFIQIMGGCRKRRAKVERELKDVYFQFAVAGLTIPPEALKSSLLLPKQELSAEVDSRTTMNVSIPTLNLVKKSANESDILPYGYFSTNADLDEAITKLAAIVPYMLELAEREQACELLSREIESVRRRVNALEYVVIPDLQETIRYIAMKLDETERSEITRLIRIKDIIIEKKMKQKV